MEVAAAAGEALISASIDALFEKLRSSELLKFARKSKLLGELKNWETMLMRINALLADAEEKQTTDQRVKLWLDGLRDLAYDIEDALDEFSTEALKRRVTKEDSYWSSFFPALSPASRAFKHEMASKIKDFTGRLQLITTQAQTLNLKEKKREGLNERKEGRPTSSLMREAYFYGRNDDKEALVQMLLSHKGGSNPISVIPIVGMGGIGKTTLAQQVYNDYKVRAYFDKRSWVYVSNNVDAYKLTSIILKAIKGGISDKPFHSLQQQLEEKLSQKKFLLVLDDVWEDDSYPWDELRPEISCLETLKEKVEIVFQVKDEAQDTERVC